MILPWTLPTLIGPDRLRSMSGPLARQLAYQERDQFENVSDTLLSYIWSEPEVVVGLDLTDPIHTGIVLEEITKLTRDCPTQLAVDGMREPIARSIAFLAARCLTRSFRFLSALPIWSTVDDHHSVITQCTASELADQARQQAFWHADLEHKEVAALSGQNSDR